ncbi:MAG TPA: FecR family protein [Planctomycetota bacterium]|nr:FecR family protein [Planctomycetota bacterium]
MTCPDGRETVALLAACGQAADDAEPHLAECAVCREEAAQLRTALEVYRKTQDEAMPASLRARIRGGARPRRRTRVLALTVAAAAVALFVVALTLHSPSPVIKVEGDLTVLREGAWQPVQDRAPLDEKVRPRAAEATVRTPMGDEIRLGAAAEVTLRSSRSLEVHIGRVDFVVARAPQEEFVVRVPFGRIMVRGTRFRVEITERSKPMNPVGVSPWVLMIAITVGAVDFVAEDGRRTPVPAGMNLTVSAEGTVLSGPQDGQDAKKCCEKVEKALWCQGCNQYLAESDVEEVESPRGAYKSCKVCAAKKGDRGVKAGGFVQEFEVCVRAYYVCKECGKFQADAGICHDTDMEQKTDKAKVSNVCEGCEYRTDWGTNRKTGDPATCPGRNLRRQESDCIKKGEPLKRVCSASGKIPHTNR